MSDWYAALKEAVLLMLDREAAKESDLKRRMEIFAARDRLKDADPPLPSVRDPEMAMATMRFLAGQEGKPELPDGTVLVDRKTGEEFRVTQQSTASEPCYEVSSLVNGEKLLVTYEYIQRSWTRKP
jgi:hypothetical protein